MGPRSTRWRLFASPTLSNCRTFGSVRLAAAKVHVRFIQRQHKKRPRIVSAQFARLGATTACAPIKHVGSEELALLICDRVRSCFRGRMNGSEVPSPVYGVERTKSRPLPWSDAPDRSSLILLPLSCRGLFLSSCLAIAPANAFPEPEDHSKAQQPWLRIPTAGASPRTMKRSLMRRVLVVTSRRRLRRRWLTIKYLPIRMRILPQKRGLQL